VCEHPPANLDHGTIESQRTSVSAIVTSPGTCSSVARGGPGRSRRSAPPLSSLAKKEAPCRSAAPRGDEDAFPLIAFGQKGEEDLHLVEALLHVSDVVEDHRVEAVDDGELLFQV
jgi:hypothetical protein